MKLQITGRGLQVTQGLKDHAGQRAAALKKYFDNIIEVDVILSLEKKNKGGVRKAEVNLWASGTMLHATESSPDMYASINGAVDRIERQLKKYKERLKEARTRKTRRAKTAIAKASEEASEAPTFEAVHKVVQLDGKKEPKIVRSNAFALKPMSVEEAALQLEVLDQQFVVFSNSDSDQVNVVYRRSDGNVGLIEPPPKRRR